MPRRGLYLPEYFSAYKRCGYVRCPRSQLGLSLIHIYGFQLRLAYVRLDYQLNDRTDLFFEGGQDWAIFSSTVLPNLFETTFLGAYYGTLYERSPQMRFGTTYRISDWRSIKISPEFAIMMPSTGQIEKLGSLGLQGQIGRCV